MNLRVIAYVLSRLQFAMTNGLIVPFFAALYWGEDSVVDFAVAISFSIVLGIALHEQGKLEHEELTIREGIAITGIAWFILPLVASLPFMTGHYLGIVDSLFEGFSGLTCTGATVIQDLSQMPKSIILWRGVMHWLGGLGIIVIFVALFPQPGSAARMFNAEGVGPSDARVIPRLKDTADALLIMYIGISMTMLFILLMCGMSLFDAVNIAMTAVATGGFATTNGSIGDFNSLSIEITTIIFMLIGGGNFWLYYIAWKKGIKYMLKDTEFKVYIILYIVVTYLIMINLGTEMGLDSDLALRQAAFETASIMTTTGLGICNFDEWPSFSKFCIILLMLTGGCAGSTSGGMKLSRVIILWKMVGNIIKEKMHPNSIANVSLDSHSQSRTMVYRVARFFFLYIAMAMLAAVFFNFDGLPVVDAILLGISCMGNAGVAFGVAYNFGDLPNLSKIVSCVCMIIGRLEIFTFLAMLQPGFWKRHSNW